MPWNVTWKLAEKEMFYGSGSGYTNLKGYDIDCAPSHGG